MNAGLHAVGFATIVLALGCSSPTEPDDPRAPPPIGIPATLEIGHCEYLSSQANCPLLASWGDLYRSHRNVAVRAEWVSTAPTVVRISRRGILERVAPGEAEVRAHFNGKTTSQRFRVLAEGPPWKIQPFTTRVNVRDLNGRPLEGVLVEITAGPMAGGSSVTDRHGSATVWNEFICGPVTVRLSKVGYRTRTRSFVNCGRDLHGQWGHDNVAGPIKMFEG